MAWILLFSWTSFGLAGQQAEKNAIRRYSQQAEQAMAEKNADAAAAALEKLVRLTPNDPEVDANLGTVYYMQSRYEQAAERFQRALELNPQMPNVQPLLGICYAELGRPQKAITILSVAFQHPPNPGVGRLIGIELMGAYQSLNENFEALEVSEELLKRYPDDPEILYRAAHMYGDQSLEIMRRLVKVAPNSPWKRMAFAEALEGEKRYDLAIIEYRKVIASDPKMPGVHYLLGRALVSNSPGSKEAQDEALKEFQQAIGADPRNAGAAYEIGEIYRRRGQIEQATLYFSSAAKINPRLEDAQVALARALISLQKPVEALPHLRVAIQLNPQNATAHFLLAEVYKAQGDSAAYQREMALYRKYRVQPSIGKVIGEHQIPATGNHEKVKTVQAETHSRWRELVT
ncbi:MAG: tetratricopeptide repeat protein [Terriglobia bacterium]